MYIHDKFFDKYFKFANPQYILIYLYFVRYKNSAYSVHQICDELGIMSNTLIRALDFWVANNELTYKRSDDELIVQMKRAAIKEVNASELTELLKDKEFLSILKKAKDVFSDFNDYDTPKIAHIYKKFPKDTVIILFNYAKEHGAKKPSYMMSVVDKLENSGITSPNDTLLWLSGKYEKYIALKKRYGEDSPLTSYEKDTFDRWLNTYKEKDIFDAIDKTILYKGKMALNYTDTILKNLKK